MTKETPLPPPFIVGEKYEDDISEYTVVSIEGSRMTINRPEGTSKHPNYSDNIPLKATIYKRILCEREHGKPLNYQQTKTGSGTPEYKYEIVTPLVAEIIEKHSERSVEFLPHTDLKKGLLGHPHARSIIDRLPPTEKHKTPEAWAGVIIVGFSKEWTEGQWPRFERKK